MLTTNCGARAVWAKGVMWAHSDRDCHAALTKCISGLISLRMRTIFKAWLVTADADIMDPDVRLDMIIDKIAA